MAAESQELPEKSPQQPEKDKEKKQEAPIPANDIQQDLTPEQIEIASHLLQDIALLYPGKNEKIDVAKLEAILKKASSILPGDFGNMHHVLPQFYSKFSDVVHCACKNGQAEVIRLLRNANFPLDKIVAALPQAVCDAIEHKRYAVIYALADSVDWNRTDGSGNIWLNEVVRDRRMAYLLASLGARDDDMISDYPPAVGQAYEIGKKAFEKRKMAIKQAPEKSADALPLKKLADRREQKRRVLATPSRRPWDPPTAEQEILIFEFLRKLKLAKECIRMPEVLKKILADAHAALFRDLGKIYELMPLSAIADVGIYSLLCAAGREGCADIIDLLKDAGFELDKTDLDIHSVVWKAASNGHPNVIRALADLDNVNWSARDEHGYSLLHGVGNPEVCRLLASLGVSDDAQTAGLDLINNSRLSLQSKEGYAKLKEAYAEGRKEFEEKRAALPAKKAFLMEALSPWLAAALCTMVLEYVSKDFLLKSVQSQPASQRKSQPQPEPEEENLLSP